MPPEAPAAPIDERLALIRGILEGAFFAPLLVNDWAAFAFDCPALMGLEDDEAFDLFVRGAVTAETIYPELAEGREPLAWLLGMPDPHPVLAHVLSSLMSDRPFLFHRVIYSLAAVSRQEVQPDDFELAEDFLTAALGGETGFAEAAADELATLHARALTAAGCEGQAPPEARAAAAAVLADPAAAVFTSDHELIMWLTLGGGLADVDPAIAPAVAVEAWAAWVGAIIGAPTDLELLGRLRPGLLMSALELAEHLSPDRGLRPILAAGCPFCGQKNQIMLGAEVRELYRCPHLVFVGSGDEAHLWEVVQHGDLGADAKALIGSYYRSPADLELFASVVNDLYELLAHQGRLAAVPVACQAAPRGFYNLRAYFMGPPAPAGDASRH